ncbi:hypothetical protein JG688_00005093, partial [Phytophthora aleatoria]
VVVESDSSHARFQGANAYPNLRSSNTRAHAYEKSGDDEEDEARGLGSLKRLFRWKPKNSATLQKNPSFIKEVEHLKNNPAIMKNLESVQENPTMMKRLKSLKNHPKLVESLQKAPKEQNHQKSAFIPTCPGTNPLLRRHKS